MINDDFISAFFSRMMYGIGAVNAMMACLYLYDMHFVILGKRTHVFGFKGVITSMAECFSFLMVSWLYNPHTIKGHQVKKIQEDPFHGFFVYACFCAVASVLLTVYLMTLELPNNVENNKIELKAGTVVSSSPNETAVLEQDKQKLLVFDSGSQDTEQKSDFLTLKIDEIIKNDISFKTIHDITWKTWLLILVIFLNSTCFYISYAIFPIVLEKKYGFTVLETGNIMFRIPLIEGISKALGVALAVSYGKRGYIIMITNFVVFLIYLLLSVLGASCGTVAETLLAILPIFEGLFYSVIYNSLCLLTTPNTVAIVIGITYGLSNVTYTLVPIVFGFITWSEEAFSYSMG